ncbi:MAG TPA: hypothetical protein VFC53_11745 [Dehalococcoidia bacterium]|jgi:hypothetical protein|nr:hypothetical protein [Dehalococcoidia bacterium]
MAVDFNRGQDAGVTQEQIDAVTEAMQILAEEDRERGVDPGVEFICPGCQRARPMPGSVLYEAVRLCNGCATEFEVARIGHRAKTCAEWLSGRAARRH